MTDASRSIAGPGLDLLILHPPDFIWRMPDEAVATIREERYLPLGAMYLATYLRRHGLRAMVVPLREYYQDRGSYRDYDDGSEQARDRFERKTARILARLIERLRPRAVGISLNYALHHQTVGILLDSLHRDHPTLPVLLGGVHATLTAEGWLQRDTHPDWVVLGEGEEPCRRLLTADFDPDGIEGLALRRADGSIELRQRTAFLAPEVISGPMDLDLFALPKWASFVERLHFVTFSRGCNWRCEFCCCPQVSGRRRPRDPERVAEEIQALADRGVRDVFVTDEALLPRSAGFEAVASVLRRFPSFRFSCLMRPDHLARTDPARIAEANIDLIIVGIESFSPQVHRVMNKGIKAEAIEALPGAIRRLHEKGLKVVPLIMLGYPGSSQVEDELSLRACTAMAEQGLLWDICVAHTAPFPGTPLAARQGEAFRLYQEDFSRWNLSEPVIELLDDGGQVSYTADQMRRVYADLEELRRVHGLGPYRSSSSPSR